MSVCKAFYAPVDITGAFLGPEYCLLQSRNYFLQEELKMSNYLSMLSDLWKNIRSNVVFLLQFIGIMALLYILLGLLTDEYKNFFIIGIIFTVINVIYQLRNLWVMVPLWLYLLTIGSILIGLVTYKEIKRK